ncbi:long-chain-fatty-acid--CoA ligase [Cytobacillus purgationiresistens]|uniref:Long-chain acyl-CoA synthetase n=1 Tax=Cytobacillus purgationiresistens TaxID=863449 RepID=A0ABU0AGH4_9BACI|nr:long-chain fatty acid--CoA ligase [Cytobacillus purgationiresistens]MDQ0270344.1 long-chain acyl-CoA synthetase [Cytobacillus purgationiresistens]
MINTDVLSKLSLYELLQQTVQEFPETIAVIDGPMQLTYEELKEAVDSFASVLFKQGLKKGDRVGLMLPNCIHYIVSYYAVQRLGGVIVQVNPQYQTFELAYILDDAAPAWFICERKQRDKVVLVQAFNDVHVIYTKDENDKDQVFQRTEKMELPPIDIETKEDVAVIQYTGGTTGQSKGVMLTHFNIVCNIHQSGAAFADALIKGEERILGVAPLTHAMSMTNMSNTVRLASTFIILEKFIATKVIQLIRKYKPTMMLGSPTMYIALLNHPDLQHDDLSCFKVCISGSAPIPAQVLKSLEEKSGANIFEGFGLSEATTSTHRTPLNGKRKIGSVGSPIALTEAKIVDELTGMTELPPGEKGELIIKGPQVMKGYWNKPNETDLVIRDGWLYTGDIAVRDEEDYYFIVGRKKDMVIAGGLNIYPAEVEEVIYQHPSVAEACTFGVPDPYLGEKLYAVVILKEGASLSAEELAKWCEDKIARYKVPRVIEFRDALPKTIVGKILRRKLVDEFTEKAKS